ncbi:MAG: response regulator [Solirubrobacteraceae bacterium]
MVIAFAPATARRGKGRGIMTIRVCVAEGHLLFLGGVRGALQAAEDVEIVAVTGCGDEVVALVEEHEPDLVLLDHRMPTMGGVACLKLIKQRHPDVKVVMFSASEEPEQITEALSAGATAYIGKRIDPRDLASVLRQIVAEVVYRPVPEAAEAAAAPTNLTQRELTMLEAISRGLSTKAISRELWISEKTVKFHLTNIYRKLDVHNRTGAMRYALEHGLVAPASSVDIAASAA